MFKGRDRNTPCWCGSGKKLKRCHLDRQNEKPPNVGDLNKAERGARRRVCLSPDKEGCTGVVGAHSVQKKLLRLLAENGHVLAVGPDKLGKATNQGFTPSRIGVNDASTFTGFCSRHDDAIFKPIEEGEVRVCREHAFLLGYRAVCLELYKKDISLNMEQSMRGLDRGRPLIEQILHQQKTDWFMETSRLGVRDFEVEKTAYDGILRSGDHGKVRALFVEFVEKAPFLASTAVQPEADFTGKQLQDIRSTSKAPLDVIAFSFVESNGRALAVFTWLEGNRSAEALVDSFLQVPKERLGAAIVRLAFEYTENLYMSPTWWNRLGDVQREWTRRRYLSSIDTPRTADALCDDRFSLTTLTVTSVAKL